MVKLRPTKFTASSATGFTRPLLTDHEHSRLGRVAVGAYDRIKQVMRKEVKLPARATQLLGSLPFAAKTSEKQVKDGERQKIQQLKKTVQQSHQVLARSKSVWPFKFFVDEVFLDRTKVTITKQEFFWMKDTISIRIEDILNITASTGPFFGSLSIASRVMSSTDHYRVDLLPKKDAIYLKHIIQGYVIAQHNNIATSHLSKQELIDTLCELGTDSEP